MAEEPAVTVVIDNHDYEQFVGAAIRSALAQRADLPVQVVVVDDGSNDGSLAAIAAFGEAVEVIAKENGGQASAFNAGFEVARAPIVAFLDADDELLPGALAAAVDALDADRAAVRVHFRLTCVDAEGRPTGSSLPRHGMALPAGDLLEEMRRHPDDIAWQPTSGNVFRAAALARVLPMPEEPYRTCADHYLSAMTAVLGPIAAVERPLGSYRLHGDNADHRAGIDLDRLRSIATRTTVTHGEVARLAVELGLHGFDFDPRAPRSVTAAAVRLVSLRSDPAAHPFPADRRWPLVIAGWSATGRRRAVGLLRRLGMAVWFPCVAVCPKRFVNFAASRALTR